MANLIPAEVFIHKILVFREENVMLDFDLANFYGVENRALKQAVRRNVDLFPADFMFQLNDAEVELLVSQNVIPSKSNLGGSNPFAFTETGVAMLSSVLKSKRAKDTNIAIMRAFISVRKMLIGHQELKMEIDKIKDRISGQDKNIELIFSYFDELLEKKEQPRTEIGYKISKK